MAGTSGQHLLGGGGRERRGGWGAWTSGQHLEVWVNTLLTCLSSHTCHFSTKFQPKFVCILKQIKIRSFGNITSATETTSVLLQIQRLLHPDSLWKRSLFLDCAKSVLCKKLHGQNWSFSSRVALVALRERWAVWSVVRLSFLSPVTLHSCNHQLPSTKHRHQLSGAIKPIWSTDFGMSSSRASR